MLTMIMTKKKYLIFQTCISFLLLSPAYGFSKLLFASRKSTIDIIFSRNELNPFLVSQSQSRQTSSSLHILYSKKEDEEDPWAAYTMNTDDDDDDNLSNEDDFDDMSWYNNLPSKRDGLPPPPSTDTKDFTPPKSTSSLQRQERDNFYNSFDEETFFKLQKEYSAKARGMTISEYESWEQSVVQQRNVNPSSMFSDTMDMESKSVNIKSLESHLLHQQTVFDDMAKVFQDEDQIAPAEVRPVLRYLAKRIIRQMMESHEEGLNKLLSKQDTNNDDKVTTTKQDTFRILDVACGSGALFPYYLQAANDANIHLQITGIDLSPKMIRNAQIKAEETLNDYGGSNRHGYDFKIGDFVSLVMGEGYVPDMSGIVMMNSSSSGNNSTTLFTGQFDAVVFNACFGNFYNTVATISAAAECLKQNGIMVISHPLGADFVRKLNAEDPDTVPHHLPTILDFRQLLRRSQPFNPLDFVEEVELLDSNKDIKSYTTYFASAIKVPHRPLLDLIRLRGPVDAGYGRGGKKLGFPTANLPSSLFSTALERVPTGVYFGWAVIEDTKGVRDGIGGKKGRNVWHKAVVNVGYSPTFQGQENREKIVEAHLIVEKDDIRGDFYNETMRLALSGFLRPEMKFPSFPDLVKQIKNDVENAKEALGMQPFAALRTDPFLTDPCKRINNTMVEDGVIWVGKSGGDEYASYEFEEMKDAIMKTPMARWVI